MAVSGNGGPRGRDYREFAFTATGRDTDLEAFGMIDLHDNLALELERLQTLAKLLVSSGDRADPDVLGGVGLLVQDIHARMREVLQAARAADRGREGGGRRP